MIQERTIAQVVRTYRDQLTNSVYETLNGRTDAMGMGRAHRDMIWRLGPDAYTEGLREGGVPAEELDAEDRKAIREWINGQWAHVSKFASDTVAARNDDGKRKQILSRLDMWVESMRVIGNQGLMSAQKNRMGTWRLGPTEEHCITKNGRIGCANLHGKRHRLSWFLSRGIIPRQPGSAILGCQGYQCLCEIRADDGTVLVPAIGRALRFDPNQLDGTG